LSKPVDAEFLVQCVGRALGTAKASRADLSPSSAEQGLPPGAARDVNQLISDMTGLYSREAFLMLTEHQMRVSSRTRKGFALMLLWVSNLEGIVQAHGPVEAEHALVQTARTVKESFRSSDIVAHVCGGEFAVLALETKSVGRDQMVRRLYTNLKHLNSETTRRYSVALDAEVVSYDPLHPVSLAELLKDYDTALVKEVKA
jgi:diguanylate cyclase (GGDEF)-like protein